MTTFLNYRTVQNPFIFVALQHGPNLTRRVSRMTYTDSADAKATQLELYLNDKGSALSGDPSFVNRNECQIRWGYPNEMSPIYTFVLVRAQPSFNSNNGPVLKVVGWDRSIDMSRGAAPNNWGSVSSSDVARKIAEKYNLRAVMEDSDDARKESRMQGAHESDISFLKRLAEALDWDCYVEGRALHFHRRMFDEKPTRTYDYMLGRNPQVIDFSPKINMNKRTKTGKAAVDAKTGTPATPIANQSQTKPMGKFLINVDQQTGTLVPAAITKSSAESNAKVVTKHAAAKQQKIDMSAAEATMTVIGDSTVRSRQPINVRGVGMYSGVWYVKQAKHDISSEGYTTVLELQRNSIEKGYKDKKGRKAAGRDPKRTTAEIEEELTDMRRQLDHVKQMGFKTRIVDRPPGMFNY